MMFRMLTAPDRVAKTTTDPSRNFSIRRLFVAVR